jgi:hypothetical protein
VARGRPCLCLRRCHAPPCHTHTHTSLCCDRAHICVITAGTTSLWHTAAIPCTYGVPVLCPLLRCRRALRRRPAGGQEAVPDGRSCDGEPVLLREPVGDGGESATPSLSLFIACPSLCVLTACPFVFSACVWCVSGLFRPTVAAPHIFMRVTHPHAHSHTHSRAGHA